MKTASAFIPDKRLARSDADITLYFLSSPGVLSTELNQDKWFRATVPYGFLVFPTGPSTLYRADMPASPVACTNQYQFCNADKDHCGPLASHIDAVQGAAPMFGTSTEANDIFNITNMFNITNVTRPMTGRFQRLTNTLQQYPIQFLSTHDLGSESLLARQTLIDDLQGRLPDDQWQREMTAWWATTLAGLQAFFVETASGVNYPGLEDYRVSRPRESFEKDMCTNQASLLTAPPPNLPSAAFTNTHPPICRKSFPHLTAHFPCSASFLFTSSALSS